MTWSLNSFCEKAFNTMKPFNTMVTLDNDWKCEYNTLQKCKFNTIEFTFQ